MEIINNIMMAEPGCLPESFKIVETLGGCQGRDRLENVFGNTNVHNNTELYRDVKFTVNSEICGGFPTPAEEELSAVISFDEYLVSHPETSFLLSVTGDSMIGAGIMEKDLVIVERGHQPKNGEIILAEVDGNWTMKYFRKKGKTIMLEADNDKYPPITSQDELRIVGVITAAVR